MSFTEKEVRDYHRLVTKRFAAGTPGHGSKCISGEMAHKGFEFLPKIPRHKTKTGRKHILRAGELWLIRNITTV